MAVSFCNIYGNINGNYQGPDINPLFGDLIFENSNGDSCDIYLNISFDPLYINPALDDYHIQETSPCIDAGDPDHPLDLDNTVTDIGAFYFDQSGSSVLRQFRKEYPLEFILIHAYPNPFNAYTTITVNLLESVPLTLTVYNVTGQLIKTLYEGNLSAGMHRFPLNATMLSSGTYLVNATVPGKMNKVQKITMLK